LPQADRAPILTEPARSSKATHDGSDTQEKAIRMANLKHKAAKAYGNVFARRDGEQKELSDYEIGAAAIEAKTARLKAARLAKEAEDKENAIPMPAKVIKSKKASTGGKRLSDWMETEANNGRKT